MLEHLAHHHRFVHGSPHGSCRSNPVAGQTQAVLVGPRFTLELLDKSLVVPHLEILDASEDANLAYNRGAVTEVRRNDDAALTIEFAGLAEIIDAVEELQSSRVIVGNLRELLLDLQPQGHRIDADALPRQTRDE